MNNFSTVHRTLLGVVVVVEEEKIVVRVRLTCTEQLYLNLCIAISCGIIFIKAVKSVRLIATVDTETAFRLLFLLTHQLKSGAIK